MVKAGYKMPDKYDLEMLLVPIDKIKINLLFTGIFPDVGKNGSSEFRV
jgi:hypothetical protein